MAVSVRARQPNTALEIFKEMERDGLQQDVVSGRGVSFAGIMALRPRLREACGSTFRRAYSARQLAVPFLSQAGLDVEVCLLFHGWYVHDGNDSCTAVLTSHQRRVPLLCVRLSRYRTTPP